MPHTPAASSTFTVFAVYEDDLQPFATTVVADDAAQATQRAQDEADSGNGAHVPLTAFQVVSGSHEVLA